MSATCANHPGSLAITQCQECKKPICNACMTRVEGAIYCGKECAAKSAREAKELSRRIRAASRRGPIMFWLRLILVAGAVLLILEWLGITDFLGFV